MRQDIINLLIELAKWATDSYPASLHQTRAFKDWAKKSGLKFGLTFYAPRPAQCKLWAFRASMHYMRFFATIALFKGLDRN